MKLNIALLITAAAFFVIYAAWLHNQPSNELFVWTIRNDAAETISAILAAICAFAGMMLIVDIDAE